MVREVIEPLWASVFSPIKWWEWERDMDGGVGNTYLIAWLVELKGIVDTQDSFVRAIVLPRKH